MIIRILKDTPFDKAGTTLPVSTFRSKYSYICTKDVTDFELYEYLIKDGSFKDWFQVEYFTNDNIPNTFIHEGVLYDKKLDGMFHKYLMGTDFQHPKTPDLGKVHIADVRTILESSKYKSMVLYCTNYVDKKI